MKCAGNKIAMFFEDIGFEGGSASGYREDIHRVIHQHVDSFEANGWEVVPVGLTEAQRHPKYVEYDKLEWLYRRSTNQPAYTRICYMRWLAYATTGLPFADLDVINFGMTPADAEPRLSCETPPIICGSHSAGLFSPSHYEQVPSAFEESLRDLKKSVTKESLEDKDVNDMTLLKAQRPQWKANKTKFGPLVVRSYSRLGWESARVVHFLHSRTPLPRSATIQKVIDAKRSSIT